MSKKDDEMYTKNSIPKILEIEEKEIKLKKPPNDKIIDYDIINSNSDDITE